MKKEKTVNDDRITYRQLGQFIDGRDRPSAHAVENAARGVNAAEQAIRQTAAIGTFETPGHAALFAEALALASQLAASAALGGGQAVPGRAAAIGAAHGRDAARRSLARATRAAQHVATSSQRSEA